MRYETLSVLGYIFKAGMNNFSHELLFQEAVEIVIYQHSVFPVTYKNHIGPKINSCEYYYSFELMAICIFQTLQELQ